MAETKYTPMPWRVRDGRDVVTRAGGLIAAAYAPSAEGGTAEHNARLIATAPLMRNLLECMSRGAFSPPDWIAEARGILAKLGEEG